MKPKFGREIALLTLPILLIGGVTWWQSAGAPGKARFNLAASIIDTRRPKLQVKKIRARWLSPTSITEFPRGGNCQLVVSVTPSHGLLQKTPSTRPRAVWMDVVDENGRSLLAILSRPRRSGSSTWRGVPFGVSWPTVRGNQVPDCYDLMWEIPFEHVPATTRSLRFKALVAWGSSTPVPVAFEVMPAWMRMPSRRLKIEKVAWQTGEAGEVGRVVVDINVPGTTKWRLFDSPTGIVPGMTYPPADYEPFERSWAPLTAGEARLIASWSQRTESSDGKTNSLKAYQAFLKVRSDKAWRAAYKAGRNEISVPNGGFAPNPEMHFTAKKNGSARLEYVIKQIPKTVKKPVFRADIFLEGDGKQEIICPLTSKAPA